MILWGVRWYVAYPISYRQLEEMMDERGVEVTTPRRPRPICGRPPPRKVFLQCFDQIACAHMSGLSVRSHMNAGQDGFRDKGSKQQYDQIEGHWVYRSVPRRGSIDHTICSSSCKFWHRLSTVAFELLPVSG